MLNLNPTKAIASPAAIKSYGEEIKNKSISVYLYFYFIIYTGIQQKDAILLTVKQVLDELSHRNPNASTSRFFNEEFPNSLLDEFAEYAKDRPLNEIYFLTDDDARLPLSKPHIRNIFTQANRTNTMYALNTILLRKTYYWNKYISSTNKKIICRCLQLHSAEDIALYFGLDARSIEDNKTARSQVCSQIDTETILRDTISTCSEILRDYKNPIHPDVYYEKVKNYLYTIDSANEIFRLESK